MTSARLLLPLVFLLAIGPSSLFGAFHETPGTTDLPPGSHQLLKGSSPSSTDLSVPSLPSIFAPSSPAVENSLCRNHSLLYLDALRNATLWAAKMFDSSAKLPTGFFFGSTHQLGNFDECLSVEALLGDDREPPLRRRFVGKYCLATIRIAPSDLPATSKGDDVGSQREDIWAKIKESIDLPSENRLNEIHWAVCIPSSCSHSDLEAHINYIMPHFDALKAFRVPTETLKVEINGNACTSNEDDAPLTKGQIGMLTFIILLVFLAVSGTVVDFFARKKGSNFDGKFTQVLLCFSVRKNVSKLSGDYKPNSPLKCLSGMKTLSMLLIILGHRLFFSLGGAVNNAEFIEERYKRVETAMLLGGLTVVDTFYLISGFLLCYIFLMEAKRVKNVWIIPYLYFRRYIRLTPIYMFIVAFYATLFIKIGYGPLWNLKIGIERDRCVQNWWTNLLYVNTMVNANEMCVIQSWYVASDMHLFIIGVPVVYLLTKRPTAGKISLSFLIIASVVVPFTVTYYQQLEPLVLSYMENLIDLAKYDTFRLSYIQTYMRGTPYFIGIALGYVLYHIQISQVKIAQVWIHVILVSSFIMGFAPILVASLFYQPGYQYNAFIAGIYASLHRVSWALAISGCILVCAIEKEWLIMKCLSWSLFKPLSKLTYTAYLLHAAIQIYGVGALQNPQHISVFSMVHQTLGDAFLTIVIAFIVSMLVEAPMLAIEKIIFPNDKKDDTQPSTKQ